MLARALVGCGMTFRQLYEDLFFANSLQIWFWRERSRLRRVSFLVTRQWRRAFMPQS